MVVVAPPWLPAPSTSVTASDALNPVPSRLANLATGLSVSVIGLPAVHVPFAVATVTALRGLRVTSRSLSAAAGETVRFAVTVAFSEQVSGTFSPLFTKACGFCLAATPSLPVGLVVSGAGGGFGFGFGPGGGLTGS